MDKDTKKKGRPPIWKTQSFIITSIVAIIAFIVTAFYINWYSPLNPIRVGVFASIMAFIITGAICGVIHLITIFKPSSRKGIARRE